MMAGYKIFRRHWKEQSTLRRSTEGKEEGNGTGKIVFCFWGVEGEIAEETKKLS